MKQPLKKLDITERYRLGRQLRDFTCANPSLEDDTGYSESHILQVIQDWVTYGNTSNTAPADTSLLLLLVKLAF